MSGQNAGLQAMVRMKASHIIWVDCKMHRHALAHRNIKEELRNISSCYQRYYVKNSPQRGRHFAELGVDTEAEHTALILV
jgi:hypothetical protein